MLKRRLYIAEVFKRRDMSAFKTVQTVNRELFACENIVARPSVDTIQQLAVELGAKEYALGHTMRSQRSQISYFKNIS